jgi:ankyrin repeat protein
MFDFLHPRVVEHLLKNNANASKRDKKGFTAIHYASVKGNKLSIEMVSSFMQCLELWRIICLQHEVC